jgi:hypothetical protein
MSQVLEAQSVLAVWQQSAEFLMLFNFSLYIMHSKKSFYSVLDMSRSLWEKFIARALKLLPVFCLYKIIYS